MTTTAASNMQTNLGNDRRGHLPSECYCQRNVHIMFTHTQSRCSSEGRLRAKIPAFRSPGEMLLAGAEDWCSGQTNNVIFWAFFVPVKNPKQNQ